MTTPITKLWQNPLNDVPVGTTPAYKAQLVDENGVPIPASALSTLTLSITDTATGSVVNNVDAVNILNTGRGSIDNSGNLVCMLLAADSALFNPNNQREIRSLTFDFTYSVTKVGRHEVEFALVQLQGA